jgi:hypothetical protein
MNRPLLHLPPWQMRLLVCVAGLLSVSGGTWLLVHYLWGAGAGELPHAWEAPLIRVHGGAAFLGLFTLGVLAGSHVPAGWRVTRHAKFDVRHREPFVAGSVRQHRRSRQRWSGLLLLILAAALVLSGYLLYYFIPEDWRPVMGWTHAALGAALTAAATWHGLRRSR